MLRVVYNAIVRSEESFVSYRFHFRALFTLRNAVLLEVHELTMDASLSLLLLLRDPTVHATHREPTSHCGEDEVSNPQSVSRAGLLSLRLLHIPSVKRFRALSH